MDRDQQRGIKRGRDEDGGGLRKPKDSGEPPKKRQVSV